MTTVGETSALLRSRAFENERRKNNAERNARGAEAVSRRILSYFIDFYPKINRSRKGCHYYNRGERVVSIYAVFAKADTQWVSNILKSKIQ